MERTDGIKMSQRQFRQHREYLQPIPGPSVRAASRPRPGQLLDCLGNVTRCLA